MSEFKEKINQKWWDTDSARDLVFMRVSGVFIGHIYHHIYLCESDHMKRYDAIKG